MTVYRCLIASNEGRSDWRSVDAATESGAVAILMADGLVPLEVRSGTIGIAERLNQPINIGPRLRIGDQALMLTQLAMLVRSGLPVDRSLDLLREQAPRARQRAFLAQILNRVREGRGLATALEAEEILPAYAIGVIRAAERSGQLSEALTSLAERMSVAAAMRRQLATALTYPAAVLAATLLALLLVLTLVVPQFALVFAGEEERLPFLTRMVLNLSAATTESPLLLSGAILLPFLLLWLFARSAAGRALLERHSKRIPFLRLRDNYLAAQVTGILATLLTNGVPVVAALPLVRDGIGSRRWRAHLTEVERRIREGMSLSRALGEQDLVPRTATRLIEVGEKSGSLSRTCLEASIILGENARARIERIVALVNPLAIIGLGGLVALLVAGVMLGIFAMGDFAQ